ncbi:hypothetical protein C2G38_2209430 [Gigaspora rosea]|uniref:Uncharacterized protein n=1 Tax=Gigaspora rosea TaxID=44941 RepID=A0A397UJF2_9GLOM|nr:hypothetical protein C2G38_2209430 [Gigaspora rosea]
MVNRIKGWTSGNKVVDNCIKEFQLKATEYENIIEWIPFNKGSSQAYSSMVDLVNKKIDHDYNLNQKDLKLQPSIFFRVF